MKLPHFAVWIPVVLYSVLIFYISSIPGPEIPTPGGRDLSFLHVPLFFGLSYLLFRTLENRGSKAAIILAIVITAVYGIFDEIHQSFVPGRDFSYMDMLFDFLGASLIIFKLWKRTTFVVRIGRIVIKL